MRNTLPKKPPQYKQHIPYNATHAFSAARYGKIETFFPPLPFCNMNFVFPTQMLLTEKCFYYMKACRNKFC